MKKQKGVISFLTVLCFLLVIWLPCQAADDLIYVCKNNKTGKPRFVSAPNKCNKTEYSVTLSGAPTGEPKTYKLACVTAGAMKGSEDGTLLVGITNNKNINITDWSEAFYTEIHPDDNWGYEWGLYCKDDWINTGCSAALEEDNLSYVDFDFDVFQSNNGCNGDNEEYELLIFFTTCCKVVTM